MRRTRLFSAALVVAAPLTAQEPRDPDGTPFFLRKVPPPADALRAYQDQPYRPVRPGEVHAAGFLTEGRSPWFGEALGTTEPMAAGRMSATAITSVGSGFAVRPPEGGTYQAGDTLIVAVVLDGPRGWGRRVIPTGVLLATGQEGDRVLTEVAAIFGPIRPGQAVYQLERFVNPGRSTPVPATGPTGEVIGNRRNADMVLPADHIYTDLGETDGVQIGDFVRVDRPPREDWADASNEALATGQEVHVSPNSSTVKLIQVFSPEIWQGARVTRTATVP